MSATFYIAFTLLSGRTTDQRIRCAGGIGTRSRSVTSGCPPEPPLQTSPQGGPGSRTHDDSTARGSCSAAAEDTKGLGHLLDMPLLDTFNYAWESGAYAATPAVPIMVGIDRLYDSSG